MIIRAIDYMSLTIISKNIKCFLIASILLVSFNLKAQITSFPYTEDFESGSAGWFAQGNTSWELGIPSTPIINSPASGSNAWVTNLNGNYLNVEDGWLQSPVFDFSALSIPEIQFAIWWNCEELYDGVVLQSSVNSGSTWERVGNYGDFNWYTHQLIDANPGGQGEGWSGHEENFTGSGGWNIVAQGLPNLIGQSNVIFRLAFGTDVSVTDEGIGFDLIKIYDGDCNAGDDQNLAECYSNADIINLNDFLSFDASTTGSWNVVDGVAVISGNEVDMVNVDAGNYIFEYSVTNESCTDYAYIFITIEKSLDAGEDGDLTTCSAFTNDDLFNALNGSPDLGGVWTQVSFENPIAFMYTHASTGSCSESTAIVTIFSILSIDASEGTEAEPCYIFETVSLNDYLPDTIPVTGGTWTFRPSTEEPDQDVPISEGDDVDFPDTGAGQVAYSFDYGVTEDCINFTYDLTVNVTIDPFPYAGEDKTITFYCYNYVPINLNQLVEPNLISTHITNWESLDGLTVQETGEVNFPDNGLGQFLYTFNYTLTNSCGQEDTSELVIYLDLLEQAISIPDSEFERYLIDDGIDSNPIPNGEIALSDICGVSFLGIDVYNISNFEGIQFFTDLTDFYMADNNAAFIDVIDFSGNPLLEDIEIYISPNFTGLDINENLALQNLRIYDISNALITVDLSNNYNLKFLNLENTGLNSIDVSNNLLLTDVFVLYNPINEIDVSGLVNLRTLHTSNTQIEFLDLSNNTQLNTVFAVNGVLTSVNVQNGFNENLDLLRLTNNPNLNCILVDDVANAETEPGWTKDATATYAESSISIDIEAQNESSSFYVSSDFPVNLDLDAFNNWLNSNGGAVASSGCGNVTWSYSYDVSYSDSENTVTYITTFVANDGLESVVTIGTFTFENVLVTAGSDFIFQSDAGINGGTRCGNDDFSLGIIDGFYIFYDGTDATYEFVQTAGPPGTAFTASIVDFPDTGAGQFLYSFDFNRELDVSFPGIELQLFDQAIVTFWVVVPFDVGEDGTLEVCEGQDVTLDDLYNALEGTPDLEGSNFDMEDLWTPSVYQGPREYTFDFSQVAPDCNFGSSIVTVSETPCASTELNLKVFLEGAYDTNTGLMRDDMRSSGILPTTSPYVDAKSCDISVFNVTGSSAIVDWIWLELRDITDQTLVIESRSAFLRADGTVVDVDGVSPLFIDVPENDYYLMLSHRNHLGVLTLDSYTFDGTTLNIDLTTSNLSVQGGNNAIASFSDGTFGLYAGDFNGDGQIQNTDRNGVTPLRGISGYNNADINLNGQVQNSDINGILTPNIGKGEQFMSRNLFAPRRQN
ncbi:hypothetical protein [Psychroserpens jangbogonensis]|uniref:hypothetical protein n=1 Tax=Psychroserpens jangbogonensis TaxID=1484460 RepID=UPI000A92537A|nr:hypothetical protein [Psychroserpens jangbogonensis]